MLVFNVCLLYQALKRASIDAERTDISQGLFWSAYDFSFPECNRYIPYIFEAFFAFSVNMFVTLPSPETLNQHPLDF